jgi:hypothetical protein
MTMKPETHPFAYHKNGELRYYTDMTSQLFLVKQCSPIELERILMPTEIDRLSVSQTIVLAAQCRLAALRRCERIRQVEEITGEAEERPEPAQEDKRQMRMFDQSEDGAS